MCRAMRIDYYDPTLVAVSWRKSFTTKICSIENFRKTLRKNSWFPIDVWTDSGSIQYVYDGDSEKMIDIWNKIEDQQEIQENVNDFLGLQFKEISTNNWSLVTPKMYPKQYLQQFFIKKCRKSFIINSIGDKANKIITDGDSFTEALDNLQEALDCHFNTRFDNLIHLYRI